MSYGIAAALQEAIYGYLSTDLNLAAMVGTAIYDEVPTGELPETYVTLGPEEVRGRCDSTGAGGWHRITVSVVTQAPGFHQAKQVAAAISDRLNEAELSLSRGHLTGLHFWRARARREDGGALRRIDLIFRARVDDAV
ncbi:hypothetical protein ROA7450_02260 [Roseovarius albus]|uniref:Gene transfer agent protein n=1 Tax=Roseovarius albus TaxID=1247867 RepID=A0A1X6ZB53_9RHOB|nr:DUF3168 domain-containing protein [Roseovarius albus]SLN46136.1 hypothetical protein ROA7450_02260 [Roseovarius albus]